MKVLLSFLLLALVCNVCAFLPAGNETLTGDLEFREGRWLFSSSKNSEESCSSSTSGQNTGMTGICRSQSQCTKQRGEVISGGNCSGKRVCCSYSVTCPTNTNGNNNIVTIRQSGSHIRSSSGSSSGANVNRNCDIKFPRSSKNICQVRLDFVDFNLPKPDNEAPVGTVYTNGNCLKGKLTVNAENLKGFETCGIANGQRLYLHYGDTDLITVNINVNNGETSNFDLFATFLPCSNGKRSGKRLSSGYNEASGNEENSKSSPEDELAPPGCDQYYTAASGEVRSFNYVRPPVTPGIPEQAQINNQQYTVCIKTPPGSKKIAWQTCADEAFWISGIITGNTTGIVQKDCNDVDYVDIPGSTFGRYCGGAFGGNPQMEPVESTARPFLMYVKFDSTEKDPLVFLSERHTIINPETGCPVGSFCVTKNNEVVTYDGPPNSVLPCLSEEGISKGQYCLVDPALSSIINAGPDMTNAGFCLKYTVSY